MTAPLLTGLGILLPESSMRSDAFAVLAAFVAINTVMYMALAVAKMLPKVYVTDWFTHRDRRGQTRSIHPDPGGAVRQPMGRLTPGPTTRPPAGHGPS